MWECFEEEKMQILLYNLNQQNFFWKINKLIRDLKKNLQIWFISSTLSAK